jgi:glutathione S-transferase
VLKLISATPSPYARKVRIALAEKDIPFELVTEVPWDSTTTTPKYNPLEKLPVLLLEDGGSVYESRLILEYLELKYPEPRLYPLDVDALIAAKQVEVICDGICDAYVLLFWERRRPEAHQSQPWIARQQRKIDGGLRALAELAGSREFVVGHRFGLADIAAGTVLRYLEVRFPDLPWRARHPDLASRSDRLEQRPSFQDSQPYPQSFMDEVV